MVDLAPLLAQRFLQGQRIALGKEEIAIPAGLGRVRVYHAGRLIGTGIMQEYGVLAPERLIATANM